MDFMENKIMVNKRNIEETVENLHKDWTPEEVEFFAQEMYEDALESDFEDYCDYCDSCEEW